jgi:hypothetical protein
MSGNDCDTRARWSARIATGISTVLTIPVALYAVAFAGMSQMACDSCFGAEADRFYASHHTAMVVLLWGLAFTGVLLLASGFLPAKGRCLTARVTCAIVAPLAPIALFFGVFYPMVDWPA